MRVDFFMVVELSSVQVEDVENPHSGPTTASTTNSTFNYGRDILEPRKRSSYRIPMTGKSVGDRLAERAAILALQIVIFVPGSC